MMERQQAIPATREPGLPHWHRQRLSSVRLVPMTAWLLWAIASLASADYATARAFITLPVNTAMAVLTSAVTLYHAQSGIQVVCEDYVQPAWFQRTLIALTRFACLAGFAATLYAVHAVLTGA
jgi:succinate dehydrogenase / fumarate reductase membrane anchor subunit